MRSRFGYKSAIPNISTRKGNTKSATFKKGVKTYKENDDLTADELILATDARFVKIGRYKMRKGLDRYTIPLGEAVNVQQTSTTGATVASISGSDVVSQPLTTTSSARLTRIDVNIKTTASSSGTLLVELWTNNAGLPGTFITRSSIPSTAPTGTLGYVPCYFVDAPLLSNATTYHIVVKGQNSYVGTYQISATTNTTSGVRSTDAGATWIPASVSFNAKIYTSTDTPVLGVFRAFRPSGAKVTVFAAGTSVYSVNDGTGAITAIKTGLSASATRYRFRMIQDAIYWVNGYDKLYKWDFTTVTEITAVPFIPDELEEHVGLLFISDSSDKTKFAWSNFGEYDVWTSTDFTYAPAPKSADAINAFAKLNGVLYPFARRNKFQFMGQDNATFQLDEASSQRGTFSQESVVYDANFIYHADDDGVWQFNGSDELNLAEDFLEDYLAIPNKSTINLDIFNGRLYIFYAPEGSADNTECFVYNLQLGLYESKDLNTFIGRSFGRGSQDDTFIQASNRVAALYYAELSTNTYNNLGGQLEFELNTPFSPFDEPNALKRAPVWRPIFSAVTGRYSAQAGYSVDNSSDTTWFDIELSSGGLRYDTGLLYDSGLTYGTPGELAPTGLFVSGEFYRLQRKYKHVAANEPVEFDTEYLKVEVQRVN